MRIIAGRHRGRRLSVPPGTKLRPTAARGREMIFDVLVHSTLARSVLTRSPLNDGGPIIDHTLLDGCCGVGSLALEALSRGARKAILIDQDQEALHWARTNAQAIGEQDRCQFLQADIRSPPPPIATTLFFLDPPYGQGLVPIALSALAEAGWLAKDAIGVVELAADEDLTLPAAFSPWQQKRVGSAQFFFLRYR